MRRYWGVDCISLYTVQHIVCMLFDFSKKYLLVVTLPQVTKRHCQFYQKGLRATRKAIMDKHGYPGNLKCHLVIQNLFISRCWLLIVLLLARYKLIFTAGFLLFKKCKYLFSCTRYFCRIIFKRTPTLYSNAQRLCCSLCPAPATSTWERDVLGGWG